MRKKYNNKKKIKTISNIIIFSILAFCLFTLVYSAEWPTSLNTKIIRYYTFNETGASSGKWNMTDSVNTPLRNLSDVYGSVATGKFGNAIACGGSNSANYGQTPTAMFGSSTTTEGSACLWINRTGSWSSAGYAAFFAAATGDGNTFGLWTRETNDGQIGFGRGADSTRCNENIVQNRWYFVCYIWNSSTQRVYLNGTYCNELQGAISYSSNNLEFSLPVSGAYLNNIVVDELAFWNRTLTDSEITTLYNNGDGITYGATNPTYPISISTQLLYPANGATTNATTFYFNANATSINGNLTNATLFVFNKTQIWQTNYTTISNNPQTTSVNLSISNLINENYTWNIQFCATNSTGSSCSFASSNYSFNMTLPKIYFNSFYSNNSFRITEYIKVNGTNFTLGGLQYRLIGADSYYLADYATNHTYDDDGNEINNSRQYVIELLNNAHYLGINVIRTWCGMAGGGESTNWAYNKTGGHYNFFEVNTPGNYSESMYASFDWLLSEASKRDIRIQCVLINNWDEYGGMNWYNHNSPTINQTYQNVTDNTLSTWDMYHDQFYNDSNTNLYFRNFINYTLNRNNTITGIQYKNDPTIFSWMLVNEPRAKTNGRERFLIVNWTKNITNYIKSIDSNHLIALGIEGLGYNETWGEGTDIMSAHNGTGVDYVTFAVHPDRWDYFAARGETSTNQDWICTETGASCTIGSNTKMFSFWFSGYNFTYNNRYASGYLADYIPKQPRHSYDNWVTQNVKWANQLNKPILLQELSIAQAAYTDLIKDSAYNYTIRNFFSNGGDGIMFWTLNHDGYYYSTQYSSYAGKMDDGYAFYVSDDSTLKTRSASAIKAFNTTKYDNNGSSWVTALNNYKYDFTINVNTLSDTNLANCSLNLSIYNGTFRNEQTINDSQIYLGTDYVFSKQFNNGDKNTTWNTICCGDTGCQVSTPTYLLLSGESPVINLISPTNDSYRGQNVTFIFNVTDTMDISYCQLFINGVLNSTNTTISKNINQTFIRTFPNTIANYTWQIKCTDVVSTTSASEIRNLNIDPNPANINLLAPLNNSLLATTSNNFTVNISDDISGLKNLTLKIFNSSGIVNLTTTTFTNTFSSIIGIVVNLIDGIYNWLYEVFDISENYNISANYTLTIDSTKPSVDFVLPTPNDYYNTTLNTITINVSGNEANFDSAILKFGSTNYTMPCIDANPYYCFKNLSGILPGIYNYSVVVNDSAGNFNISQSRIVNFTSFGYVYNMSPNNNSYYNSNNVNFSANLTSSSGVSNYTINVYNNELCYQETANASNINDGRCSLNYSGSYSFDGNYSGGGNGLAPIVFYDGDFDTYHATYNGTNRYVFMFINYSKPINAVAAIWKMKWDISSNPTRIPNTFNSSLDNNCFNQNIIQLRIFTNSSTSPTIIRGDCWNGSEWIGNYNNQSSVTTAGLGIYEEAIYWNISSLSVVNQTTIITPTNPLSSIVSTIVNLADGIYQWFVSFFDSNNQQFYSSENYTITIDATNPNINITYPINGNIYTENVTYINYTLIETNKQYCWFSNGSLNSTAVLAGTNFTNLNASEGLNTWRIYCNDSAGNVNFSQTSFYQYSSSIIFSNMTPVNNNRTSHYGQYNDFIFAINITGISGNITNATLHIVNNNNEIYNNISILRNLNESVTWTYGFSYPYYQDYTWFVTACNNMSVCINSSINNLYIYSSDFNIISFEPSNTKLLENVTFILNISEPLNNRLAYCNFTLKHPSGAIVINNINGTKYNTNLWNSTTYIYPINGTYNGSVRCLDRFGTEYSNTKLFNVTYNLIINPSLYEFSAKVARNETNSYNISLYDDINSSILFNVSIQIDQSENFTYNISSTQILLNGLDNINNSYKLLFSLNASTNIGNGSYYGNITFTNTTLNMTYKTTFIYYISPPAGLPTLYSTNNVLCALNNSCAISTFTQMGSQITLNYKVNNTGFFNMRLCNVYLDNNFENNNYAKWTTFDKANFSINQNESVNISISFNPSETYIATGYYGGNLYIKCDEGDLGGNPQSSLPDNRPSIGLTVLARPVELTGGGGGGGGGTPIIISVPGNESWIMQTEDKAGSFTFNMAPGGERLNKKIEFINKATVPINISVLCSGPLCSYISLARNSISLPVAKDYVSELSFDIKLPINVDSGEYINNIIAEDQFRNKGVITIKVNVGSTIGDEIVDKLFSNKDAKGIKIPYILIFLFIFFLGTAIIYFLLLRKILFGLAISAIIALIISIISLIFI